MTTIPYFVYGADLKKGQGTRDYGVLFLSDALGCGAERLRAYCEALRKEPTLPTTAEGGEAACDFVEGIPLVIGVFVVEEVSGRKALRCAGVRLQDVIEGRADVAITDVLGSWRAVGEMLRGVALQAGPAVPIRLRESGGGTAARFRRALEAVPTQSVEELARILLRCTKADARTTFASRRSDAIGWCLLAALVMREFAPFARFGVVSTSAGTGLESWSGTRLVFTDAREFPVEASDLPEERVRNVASAIEACRRSDGAFGRLRRALDQTPTSSEPVMTRLRRRLPVMAEAVAEFFIVWAIAFLSTLGVLWILSGF